MQMFYEGEQVSMFAPDSCAGKMSPAHSPAGSKREMTSGSSWKKRSELVYQEFMFLKITLGDGDILGQPYWEILSPYVGESSTLNTGVCPRVERGSSLWQILEPHPHRKYFLSRKACLGILRRARKRGKVLPAPLHLALEMQSGLRMIDLMTLAQLGLIKAYRSRAEVGAAIEKAIDYLSAQQLDSGGFLRYGEEDVEEDAAVLEMLAALDISPDDERFVKNGHTVLDGMMDWYQESYFDGAPAPGQGFYRHDILWGYRGSGDAWYASSSSLMSDPDAPDDRGKAVERRTYINEAGLIGFCSVRPAVAVAGTPSASTPEKGNRQDNAIDYSELLQAQSADYAQKLAEGYYGDGNSTIVSEGALSHLAKEILSMSEAGGGKLPEEQRAQLESLVEMLSGASGEYLMGRKANTYSPVLVQAMKALDMDPADVNGMDFLAPLTNLSAMDTAEYREALMDFDSVDASMWRKRGVDADTVVDKYAAGILQYQTADGQFDPYASYSGIVTPILRDYVQYTAENVTALAPHADKEYISKAIDRAIEYLSSVQLSDGSFPGMTGTSNGEATLAVLEMMEALGISLDDPRFVKNGNTAADAMKTFYVDGVGFLSSFEVEAPLDDLGSLPVYADPVMDASAAVSALTYLQAAEDGTFGPDGKGSSVFEVVGAALTETPLGAILLAVIVVAILAFAMVRRYRRIKREQ